MFQEINLNSEDKNTAPVEAPAWQRWSNAQRAARLMGASFILAMSKILRWVKNIEGAL